MSDFEKFRREPQAGQNSGIWNLAAVSFAACLCSVLGAKLLSQSVNQTDLAVLHPREDGTLRQLADSAPAANKGVTIVRRMGVDGVTTATIPNKFRIAPQPLTPCGEEQAK